jgi:nitroreductase
MDVAGADELLTTTRAVRRALDLDRPVDRALIDDALRVAVQAPNARNEQAWRWIVVSDPDVRAAVAAIAARGLPAAGTGPPPSAIVASARHLVENLHRVPVLIFAGMATDLGPDATARQRADFYNSILPALWSLQLALRARGLGSAPNTAVLAYDRDLRTLLGVPDEAALVAMLAVGHTTRSDFRPAARRPVSDVAFADRWGEPWT